MIGWADAVDDDGYADAAAGADFVDGADADAGADVDFVYAIARDGVIARASRVVRDNPLTRAS